MIEYCVVALCAGILLATIMVVCIFVLGARVEREQARFNDERWND